MKKDWKVVLILELCALTSARAAGQTPSSPAPQRSLGDLARELRAKRNTQNPCPPATACDPTLPQGQTSPSQIDARDRQYHAEIQALVERRAFDELDKAARSVRASKERLGGGAWKLYEFYQVVSLPPAGEDAPESAWLARHSLLKDWVAQRPQSITARVALAQFYHLYGFAARGGDYADTVPDEGWKLLEARTSQAYKILLEAEKLPEKCPHWYFLMLDMARDQAWSKEQTRAAFERAIAFEPAYYHYYREYALYLLPQWFGEPGEAEALAEESDRRIGGAQGAFVYFEIATVIYCACVDEPPQPTLSWTRLQEGFAEVEKAYGATTLKLNRFAALAYLYHDREVARRAFAKLGENWVPAVWGTPETFQHARAWAGFASL